MTTAKTPTPTNFVALSRQLVREQSRASGYRMGRQSTHGDTPAEPRQSANCAVLPLRPR
jgi:hypothetical protein